MRTALLHFKRTAKLIRRKGSVHVPRRKRPRQPKDDCARRLAFTPFNRELRTLPHLSCRHRTSHSIPCISKTGNPKNKPGIGVTSSWPKDMSVK
jgi:hypothetical protein